MNVLKKFFLPLLFVIAMPVVFAQNTGQGNADIVILVDTSGTVLQYYEEINKRVLKEITNKFVRKGDTVHILSFNADARYEMSQKINSEADLSRVVSRFFLLYQLGKNSDFLTGLSYCKQYTANLKSNKEQILIVISDGLFNPPETSPYKNYTGEQIKNEIGLLAGNIRKQGWKVYYVKLPYPSDAIIRDLDGEEFYNSTASGTSGGAENTGAGSSGGSGSDSGTGGTGAASGGTAGTGTTGSGTGWTDFGAGESTGSSSGNSGDSGLNSGADGTNSSGSSETGSKGQESSDDENGGSKEYTDVSKTFTDSTGASTSELSGNGDFSIDDNGKNLPSVIFPEQLEAHGNKLNFILEIINNSEEDVDLKLTEIVLDNGMSINRIPVQTAKIVIKPNEKAALNVNASLPPEYSEGNYDTKLRLEFEDGKKVLPQVAELRLSVFPTALKRLFGSNPLLIIIPAVLILLLLLFLIFFLFRRKTANPVSGALRRAGGSTAAAGTGSSIYSESNKDRVAAQSQADENLRKNILSASLSQQQPRGSHLSPANHLEKIEIKRNQSGMTEIYVLNQNRCIGKRNIHVMKPGTRLSVGGGKTDDFLIFLVPFPAHLAQVRYDGQDYHLAILKPEYFPYETSNVVNNCIGKTVTAVSDKGYHVYFTFRGYEDPAVKLNSILTSINYT